jgi:hypothetical protein
MIDPTRYAGTDQDVSRLLGHQEARRSEAGIGKQKAVSQRPIPKHEQGGRFVRGPIPLTWLQPALLIGGKAGNLALAIWWLVGMQRSNPIKLTSRVMEDFGISTRSARRLLTEFERVGLVEVDRQRGRGPIVTLLIPP